MSDTCSYGFKSITYEWPWTYECYTWWDVYGIYVIATFIGLIVLAVAAALWSRHKFRGEWKCAHLNLTADGYCPQCNRFAEDFENEYKSGGLRF